MTSQRTFTALAVAAMVCAASLFFQSPTSAQTQCLDRTACKEIKSEIAELRPDVRAAKQKLKRARQALRKLEPGSDRWLAKRAQSKRLRRSFKSLARELKALQQDFRHQACSSC